MKIENMNLEHLHKIENVLENEFDNFWNYNILKSELESENSKYIVAIEDSAVLGFAGILILPDSTEITNIVVRKDKRKKGIGKLLLDRLILITKNINKESISLEVNEKNEAAIKLYENAEFKKVGLRKKYYNNIDDAIIMTKKIV